MEKRNGVLKPYEGTTLRMVTGYTEDSEYLVSGLLPKLEAETGIELMVEQVPHDDLYRKQIMDVNGAQVYDIVNPCAEWFHQYENFTVPLNSYMGKEGYPDPQIDDIISRVWKVWNPTKDVYWFPYQPDSRVFYYRKDLLQEAGLTPPKNWDELKMAVTKLHKKGTRYGFGFPGKKSDFMNLAWIPILFSAGGDIFDENLRPTLNSQAGVDSLEFLLQLLKYGPPDASQFGKLDHYQAAKEGRVAIGIEASGISQALESPDSKVKGKIGIDIFPVRSKDVQRPYTAIMGGWSLGVTSYSKHIDAAAWVVFWLTSKDIVTDWQIHGRAHASRFSMVKNTELLKVNPHIPTIVKNFAGTKLFFDGSEGNLLEQALMDPLFRAISGEMGAKEALDRAADEFESILDQAGYYTK
ncbi:MAG: sugar ABC transporter substrate-binding protein [Candidatus Atribacteria bacterium]|nr:sugar ABC transporter substrate-binding protein [Candidatus Atribacteria bacterium]